MEAPRVRPTIVYTIEESITAAGGVAYILLYTVHSNVSLSMPKHEDCMIDPNTWMYTISLKSCDVSKSN